MPPFAIRHGANLPHWTTDQGSYAVTFRLADSLPAAVRQRLADERDRLLAAARDSDGHLPPADAARLRHLHDERIQQWLDAGHGACHLQDPRIADMVAHALTCFDGHRYRLHAWAVMPNHVHALFTPAPDHGLARILHSWKSFTAKAALRILGCHGPFWQAESYDHLIRNEDDFQHARHYIRANPERAGLVGWRWVGGDQA
jgi:REP element-mobilizing transposase RayT